MNFYALLIHMDLNDDTFCSALLRSQLDSVHHFGLNAQKHIEKLEKVQTIIRTTAHIFYTLEKDLRNVSLSRRLFME